MSNDKIRDNENRRQRFEHLDDKGAAEPVAPENVPQPEHLGEEHKPREQQRPGE